MEILDKIVASVDWIKFPQSVDDMDHAKTIQKKSEQERLRWRRYLYLLVFLANSVV